MHPYYNSVLRNASIQYSGFCYKDSSSYITCMSLTAFLSFSLMNLNGDLEDLEPALGAPTDTRRRITGGGSCSALVKLLPGMSDLLVSHDMWGNYQAMLRIFKLYNFTLHQSKQKHGMLCLSTFAQI